MSNIRDLLPLSFKEFVDEHYKEKNDSIVLIRDGKIEKIVGNVEVIKGGLWNKKEIGLGEPKYNFNGIDDVYEEYDKYKTEYFPIFDSLLLTQDELKHLKSLTEEERIEYANKNPDKLLKLGERKDKSIVMWYSEYQAKIDYEKYLEDIKNIHVVKHEVFGNLGNSVYYALSNRVSKKAWNIIKDYFYYADASKFHDELWTPNFKGYAIKADKVEELEDLLEIPQNLRYKALKEEHEKRLAEEKKEKEKIEELKKHLEKLFDVSCAVPIPPELLNEWRANPIVLEGERIDNPFNKPNIYGGGQWFIIQDEYIWRVYNNGHDGDDWSVNFVRTGGAGAYAHRFKKNEERLSILRELEKLTI